MTETKREVKKATGPIPNLAMTKRGFEPTTIEEAWLFAEALAQSEMVPDRYRNKPRDCLVVLDLSARLGCSWLAIMQHVYSVYGRLGMESALVTALVNQSGMFVDPIEYEVQGKDAFGTDYKVRAHAKRKSTGTVLYGPWIDWRLVKAEGWDSKTGSKWKTMPEQMFHYRAAAWFKSRHCPEVTMGMLTTEEAEEIPRKHVDSVTFEEAQKETNEKIAAESGSQAIKVELGDDEPPASDEESAARKAKAEKEKKKLVAAAKKAEAELKARSKRQKKAKNKDKDKLPKYHCDNCNRDFDIPIIKRSLNQKDDNKLQCPKCLSLNVNPNPTEPNIDPDIHEDNN